MDYLLQASPHPEFIELSNKSYLLHLLQDNSRFRPGISLHCKELKTVGELWSRAIKNSSLLRQEMNFPIYVILAVVLGIYWKIVILI